MDERRSAGTECRFEGQGEAKAIELFRAVTQHLDETMLDRFGRAVDANVVLYLGLCNGAGLPT